MVRKRDFNAPFDWFNATKSALKLTTSFAMLFAKAFRSMHAPIKRQNDGAPINGIEMHTMPSTVKAAKYPNGVIQSNGNLKIELSTWISKICCRPQWKCSQKWKWQKIWFVAHVIDVIVDDGQNKRWQNYSRNRNLHQEKVVHLRK